jgi:hypothetical protein
MEEAEKACGRRMVVSEKEKEAKEAIVTLPPLSVKASRLVV